MEQKAAEKVVLGSCVRVTYSYIPTALRTMMEIGIMCSI
jgi:hypothetical protein